MTSYNFTFEGGVKLILTNKQVNETYTGIMAISYRSFIIHFKLERKYLKQFLTKPRFKHEIRATRFNQLQQKGKSFADRRK